jgi:stress response protein SCP2
MKSLSPIIIGFVIISLFIGGKKGVTYYKQRGLRLNNPGNIRHSKDAWVGKSQIQKDESFVTFDTPEHGIRALYKNLVSYRNNGFNTVEKIISRWAPNTENNTASYIQSVAKYIQVNPKTIIPLNKYPHLIASIIKHENGIQPFSNDIINTGIAMS